MFLRLCSRAPLTVMKPVRLAARRAAPRCARCPARNLPGQRRRVRLAARRACPRRRPGRRGARRPGRSRRRGRPTRSSRRRARRRCTLLPRSRSRRSVRDEPQVVALVQADRRLVEHVHHARQLGAELRRQPDALRLAARQRRRRAVERQVLEPDVEQEAEPRVDLLEDLVGDLRARALEPERREVLRRASATVIAVTSTMALAGQEHRARLGPQALALAGAARAARGSSCSYHWRITSDDGLLHALLDAC